MVLPKVGTSATIKGLPFNSIPGPVSLPLVGTLWSYLPYIGSYSFETLHHNGFKKYEKHGPVIREEFVPGTNTVWLTDPDDFKAMYKAEGKYPMRRSHLALEKFRRDQPDKYVSAGLLPTNGPQWYRLRSIIQKKLSRPQEIKKYIVTTNRIIDDCVDYLEENDLRHGIVTNFLPIFSRLFLEIIVKVVFNMRLFTFRDHQLNPNSTTNCLINAAEITNSVILQTDNGLPLWKYYDTPLYKQLKNAQTGMERMANIFLWSYKLERSLLDDLRKDLSTDDLLGFACDMLLAGIDTTAYTMCFVFYHLSRHPEIQEKLFNEVMTICPEGDITAEVLENVKYTKYVLKESLRLNPISIGVGRILDEDAIFSGYNVPKGTVCVTMNQISCRLPKYFKDPEIFRPERWDRNSEWYRPTHPYLSLPFGHGPRSCIARRLSEQNMLILIMKMVRKFKMEWAGKSHLDTKSLLINKPDGDVLIKLQLRG